MRKKILFPQPSIFPKNFQFNLSMLKNIKIFHAIEKVNFYYKIINNSNYNLLIMYPP